MSAAEPLLFRLPPVASSSLPTDNVIQVYPAEPQEEDENDASHDVGLVLWPSSVMLSRYLCRNPDLILKYNCSTDMNSTILELGAGCGLVGLVAAKLIQQGQTSRDINVEAPGNDVDASTTKVIFTDYNTAARTNLQRNAKINHLELNTSVCGLDFWDQKITANPDDSHWIDMEGTPHTPVQLILGADIICYSNDADLLATTIQVALLPGGQAIIVGPEEDRRFGVAHFEEACRTVGLDVQVSTMDMIETEESKGTLEKSLLQTGKYSEGYKFTMFQIDKPK